MSHTPIEKIVQSSDGTAIWAEAVGDPSKPSILFAHGLWLSAGVFDDVFRDERLLDNAYLVRIPRFRGSVTLYMSYRCAMICEATAGAVSPRKKRTRPRCLQTTMRRSFVHSTYRDHCMLAGQSEFIAGSHGV